MTVTDFLDHLTQKAPDKRWYVIHTYSGYEKKVRVRIIAVSLNEKEPRESKIGLTMRQTGLGKQEWLEAAQRAEADGLKAEAK